jgi:hypothetical protein
MKKIVFAYVLLLSIRLTAQDSLLYGVFRMMDGRINYTRIVNIDSTDKNKLFVKIKEWAVNSYKSQKVTLDAEDKDAGYLVYKGYLVTVFKYEGGLLKNQPYSIDLYHTLKFYIKDDRVKIVFTDLETLSHDLGSEYLKDYSRHPLEKWGLKLDGKTPKKQEKWRESNREGAVLINKYITAFLLNIEKALQSKKSEFDF